MCRCNGGPAVSNAVLIATPNNGSTVSGDKVIVTGSMDLTVPVKGVAVQVTDSTGTYKYPANMNGWYFAAKVPVSADSTITVISTDLNNATHQASVTIYVNYQQNPVSLSAAPSTGIPTLKQDYTITHDSVLSVSTSLPTPVANYVWDVSGRDNSDVTCAAHSSIMASYRYTGLYLAKVTVTDSGGHTYTDTAIVNVLDRTTADSVYKPIWNGMKEKLGNSTPDIAGAITSFSSSSQSRYTDVFNAIGTALPQMVQDMQEIQAVYMTENTAKYRIRKNEVYGGQNVEITYYIYFTRDDKGVWAIDKF